MLTARICSFLFRKKSNRQPVQATTESNNMSGDTEVTEDEVAEKTFGPEVEKSATMPLPQTSDQQLLSNVLPTAIEIIEESSSQASVVQGTEGGLSPASLTEMDPKSLGLQSSDYSPSLLRLLGTDNSSSEASMQAYLSRKLDTRREEIGEPGPSSKQTKGSMSDPNSVTPALNLILETTEPKLSEPAVTFLAPLPGTEPQIESKGPRGSIKRPRVGRSFNVDIQPPPMFGLLSSYLVNSDHSGLILARRSKTILSDRRRQSVVLKLNWKPTLNPPLVPLVPPLPKPYHPDPKVRACTSATLPVPSAQQHSKAHPGVLHFGLVGAPLSKNSLPHLSLSTFPRDTM